MADMRRMRALSIVHMHFCKLPYASCVVAVERPDIGDLISTYGISCPKGPGRMPITRASAEHERILGPDGLPGGNAYVIACR